MDPRQKRLQPAIQVLIEQQLMVMAQQLNLLKKTLLLDVSGNSLPSSPLLHQKQLLKEPHPTVSKTGTTPTGKTVNLPNDIIDAIQGNVEEVRVDGISPRALENLGSITLGEEGADELDKGKVQHSSVSNPVETTTFPLSPGQRDLWFLSSLGADKSAAYNESVVLRLRGELQLSVLKMALQAMVDRRDALRIISINGDSQTITSSLQVDIPYLDLSGESEPAKQKHVDAWLEAATAQAFDLNQGPFFRPQLAQLDRQDYLMVIVVHHLIADGWSIEVITQEIAEFYSDLCHKTALRKPEPVQFCSYVEWLKALQTSQQLQVDTTYWFEVLQTSIPTLALPTDRLGPSKTYKGELQTVTLDNAFYKQLQQFSQMQGATLFMTLLAAWKVFLSRLTNQERLVVGVPAAGQLVMGARNLVGHCSSVLPIISSPVRDLVFTQFLASVKKTLLDVYDRQSYFLADGPNQIQSQSVTMPKVIAAFNIDKLMDEPKLYGLEAMLMPSPVNFAKFDLALNVVQFKDKFILAFNYRTDLFDNQTISHWCRSFQTLLHGIVAWPESQLYQLPLIPSENHKVFPANSTAWDVQPIHQLFETQVSRNCDAIAIKVGDESIAYGVLNHRANQLARYLAERKQTEHSKVVIYLKHPIQIAIALLAGLKAGKSLALINPKLSADRIQTGMDKWAGSLLLTDSQLASSLPECKTCLVNLDVDWSIISHNGGENLKHVDLEFTVDLCCPTASHQVDSLQLSYLALSRHVASLQKLLPHTANDQVSILNQFAGAETFDIFFHVLTAGAALIVPALEYSDDSDILAAFEDKANTVTIASLESFVPLARACRSNPELLAGKKQRWVILDRGELRYGQIKQLVTSLGESVEFYRVYKSPAIPLTGAVKQVPLPLPNEQHGQGGQPVPLGTPIGEVRFAVRDSYAQVLPVGIPGELCMEHPLLDSAGIWITTGDRARQLAEGSIEIHGSMDKHKQVSGTQIEPREIEVTLRLCPLVQEAVVTESQPQGSAGKTELRVYVVLTSDELQVLREVEQFLRTLLAEPEIFVLMRVETIPRTPSGNVDYSALREIEGVSVKAASFVAPSNSTEQAIADCVQQTLGKTVVSVYDNFFDLGLQSLQGVRLLSMIQTKLAVDLSLSDLFEAPTVARIAARIRGKVTQPLPPLHPLAAPTDLPGAKPFADYELSPAQRSLWVHAQMDSSSIAYNLCMSSLWEGYLDVEALQRSFETIVARHESLRTTFVLVEDEPRQRVHDTIQVSQEFIDLSGDENPEERAREYGFREARKPFDLASGPLMRAKLLKLSNAKHVLLFTIHHIIIDGWSLEILEKEVFQCYTAYRSGQEPQLPPLRIQYKDYAVWQNAFLQTDRICKQRDYWLNKLAGARPALNLPTDFARPPVPTFNGSVISLGFDRSLRAGLNRLSRQYSASPYMVLVAAVKTLFYRITQQNDIIVGTSFAERAHPDLEGQIGFFINPLVLRDAIAGHQSFLSVLHQVRQTVLEALENALYPFDILVNELQQMDRGLQSLSLFEVQVVMENRPQTHIQMDGLKVSAFQNVVLASRFDMIFNFIESDDQLRLDIEYKTDLWKPERIEVIKERFYALIVDIIACPEKRLDDLKFQTSYEEEVEETELIFNFNF